MGSEMCIRDSCQPIAHCQQHEVVTCNWHNVTCAPAPIGGIVQEDVQWYLGMKGILLPGKGIGIDSVEPGSPADQVGLQPGMVLTNCNGIDMVDDAAMQQAIATSGGVLQMTLLSTDGTTLLQSRSDGSNLQRQLLRSRSPNPTLQQPAQTTGQAGPAHLEMP